MAKKIVLSYYMEFNSMFFQKENMLKPLLLAEALDCKCEVYYGENTDKNDLPKEYCGAKLRCQNYKGEGLAQLLKVSLLIIKNARRINNLMTFHVGRNVAVLTLLLKFLNPKASVWVSGDIEIGYAYRTISELLSRGRGIKGYLYWKLYRSFFKKLDVYSVETIRVYNCLMPLFSKYGLNNLVYLPCGVDGDYLNKLKVPNIDEKQNLILSVSRFGPYQKNSEMLLEGLSKLNFRDWKVLLVGPITNDFSLSESKEFQCYIDDYFRKNPKLKDVIQFTGPIFDAKRLYDLFNKSKIFIMTSRHEAFANVFSQARWYRCHIASTDVGGAPDMSNNWEFGTCINQEDPQDLANKLQVLMNGDIPLPTEDFAAQISYQYLIASKLQRLINKG